MAIKREERKEWARETLRGIEGCTMPSFKPGLDELDEEGIRWDVRYAINQGFFSTMVTCETGQTLEENKRFLEIVCDEAKGKIQVSFTLLVDSFEEAIELLEHGEKVGASHALMGYPPNFRPQGPDDIYEKTAMLSEATNLGLVMYASDKFDFIRFHPSQVPHEAYDKIADLPNVVSLKVGFGDAAMTFEAFERYSDRVLVNCGTPWLTGLFPLLHKRYGAQWFGGGAWDLWQSPEKRYLVEYYNHVVAGDTDKARQVYWQMAPANQAAMAMSIGTGGNVGLYHWPFGKYISWSVGANGGLTRDPAMRLTNQQMMMRKNMLRAIGIEPREPDAEFFVGRVNYKG